jgi:hypothetical protein
MGVGQRRVATELIRENLRLRTQLNRLKAKTALQVIKLKKKKTIFFLILKEIWLTAAKQKDETKINLLNKEEEEEENNNKLKLLNQEEKISLNETKVLKVMARDLARREAEIERKEVLFFN